MASNFASHREAILKEYEEYFQGCPYDMSRQFEIMDQWYEELDTPYPYEKKALTYRGAAKLCDVQIFRQSPFYFELKSGRIRNSSQNGFPPGPGLEGWYMRKKMSLAENFQEWMRPYKEYDLVWGDIFFDLAHHNIGYDNLLRKGLSGMRGEVLENLRLTQDERAEAFYRSVLTGLDSLREIAEHFAEKAERLLKIETEDELRDNLQMIARTACRIPEQPAENFYEALCGILFYKELMTDLEGAAIAILGHLDRLLGPYYERDVAQGTLNYREAKNLMAHFLIHTDARWDLQGDEFASTNNSLVIGGCQADGAVIWNDVSRMILEIYDEYNLVNPKIQVRISKAHPRECLEQTSRIISRGNNVFSFLNDDVIIPAHVKMGKKLEDARLYSAGGCQEPVLDNREYNARAFVYINLPQAVNAFFYPKLGTLFEREESDYRQPEIFYSFEEFYQDYVEKMGHLYLALTGSLNSYGEKAVEFNPCPLISATLDGCLERGRDLTEGGTIYNSTSLPLVGIGTAINSLLAIKNVIFDKQMMTMDEFRILLESNFESAPRMREYLLNRCPKYGEDTAEVNTFINRFFRDMARVTSGIPNNRGGLYEASLFVFYLFDWMKGHVGATPDGRLSGTVLSRGMNPPDISSMKNVAQLLHTVQEIDMTDYPGCGVLYLEMPLMREAACPEHLVWTLEGFIRAGGSALDLNLLDPGKLIKAKEHPEEYGNMIVRVCGFSAYFTSLDPDIQDEIIGRTFVND